LKGLVLLICSFVDTFTRSVPAMDFADTNAIYTSIPFPWLTQSGTNRRFPCFCASQWDWCCWVSRRLLFLLLSTSLYPVGRIIVFIVENCCAIVWRRSFFSCLLRISLSLCWEYPCPRNFYFYLKRTQKFLDKQHAFARVRTWVIHSAWRA